MRRLTTAAVAAATALTLATAPAMAEQGGNPPANSGSSSNPTTGTGAGEKKDFTSSYEQIQKDKVGSSDEGKEASDKILKSSLDNDAKNKYPKGTTFDILLGTGIAAAVLALLATVMQGGFTLPF